MAAEATTPLRMQPFQAQTRGMQQRALRARGCVSTSQVQLAAHKRQTPVLKGTAWLQSARLDWYNAEYVRWGACSSGRGCCHLLRRSDLCQIRSRNVDGTCVTADSILRDELQQQLAASVAALPGLHPTHSQPVSEPVLRPPFVCPHTLP